MYQIDTNHCIIVVPTYNESENITELLTTTWKHNPGIHVLVVDDNSQDGTPEKVKDLQKAYPNQLHMLQRSGKLGLASAYVDGFNWALSRHYKAIIEMDADFSHDPAEVTPMIRKFNRCDAVIGSRYVPGGKTVNWHPLRKLISRGGSLYARTVLGMNVKDLTGGFNAWKAEVLQAIDLASIQSEGYSFQIELKYRCNRRGFRICEHPITFSERREGHSKMSWNIVLEAFYRIWSFRSQYHLGGSIEKQR